MDSAILNAIVGGVNNELAVSLMLIFNGRVTGISGIISGILTPKKKETAWRILFVLGLFAGGATLFKLKPDALELIPTAATNIDYAIAGSLVGFGTLLGSGCTSGHGVCGLSRMSVRSVVATVVFMAFGVLSVVIFNFVRGV